MNNRSEPIPEPWDGREDVMDVLARHGLDAAFQRALTGRDNVGAIRSLLAIGVDHAKAIRIVSLALRSIRFELN